MVIVERIDENGAVIDDASETQTIGDFFDKKNRHQMNQRRYCERLCDYIMQHEISLKNPNDFLVWVAQHPQRAKSYAIEVVKDFVEDKRHTIKTWLQYTKLHIRAFRTLGIDLENETRLQKILHDQQTVKERLEKQAKEEAEVERKLDDIDTISSHYESIVKMSSTFSGMQFRTEIKQTLSNFEGHPNGVAKDTIKMLKSLCNNTNKRGKSNDYLFAMQLKIGAYVALAAQLGVRSNNLLSASLDRFEITPNNDLLFQYTNRKNGGNRPGTSRISYTRVVFHKDPDLCAIVKMSLFAFYVVAVIEEDDFDTPFFFGHSSSGCEQSTAEIVRRQMTVLLLSLLNAAGVRLKSKKRLHLFRSLCTNMLIDAGCLENERHLHLGWKTNVEQKHYAAAKRVANKLTTPYVLAGRNDKDDEPHPMYTFVGRVPDEIIPDPMNEHPTLQFFARVAITTIAAGFASESFMEYVVGFKEHPQLKRFAKDVQTYIWAKITDVTNNKRSRDDLEIENADLRKELELLRSQQKQRRIERQYTKDDLKHAVRECMKHCKDDDFPQLLVEMFDQSIVPILDQIASKSGFGVNRSSGLGKSWSKLVKLTAFTKKHSHQNHLFNHRRPHSSWLGFVQQNNSIFSALPSLQSWQAFKSTYQIAR